MAKTIAIQLEIDGVQQAVTTIGELETAIEQLTEELKETEIGSERFNQLTVELNDARSALKSFEQTFEGLDPQQQTQAYLAFGESVVSGILLAQEALRSFGVENESVNNAVEKSTQAINLALQARIVIEGALEARVIATTIAQRALNTATIAGNTALRTLFTTMAANPLGAVLAVIGLLVAAFISLSESTDESTEAFGENEQAQRDLELQTRATTRSINNLKEETDELLKQYETFTLSQATTELASLEEQLQSLVTQQSAIRDFGQDVSGIANDILNGVTSLNDLNLTLAEQELLLEAAQDGLERYIGVYANENSDRNIESIENLIKILEDSISKATAETEGFEKRIEFLQKRIKELRAELSATALENFTDDLEDAAEAVGNLNRQLLEFGEVPEPPIIEELKELLQLQLDLRKATEENRKSLTDIFTGYLTDVSDAKTETDKFGERVDEIREDLTAAFVTGDIDTFGDAIKKVQEEFLSPENVKNFTDEQNRAINQILSGYEVAFNSLTQLGVDTSEEFENIVLPLLDGLTNKLQLEGKINFTEVGGSIEEFRLSFENIEQGTVDFYNKRQELIDTITEELLKEAELNKMNAEDREKATENAVKLAEEQADAIIEIISNTAEAEDAIRGVLFATQELTDGIQDTSNDFDEIFGLIIQNFDKIEEEFDIENLISLDPSKIEDNLNVLTDFFKNISNGLIDLETLTQEQRLEILEEFLDKRQELLQEDADKQEEIINAVTDDYLYALNEVTNIGNQLNEFTRFQVEVIQNETEALLNEVVGDSEQAAALREEIQEESTAKILDIERRAQIRSLNFQLIQSVADAAAAVINALKIPPPAGTIAAAAVGVSTSLQIGLIQAQLEELRATPTGFKEGGYVSGIGDGKSDSIPAMLSNGEFVINAKSTEKYLPLLEQINDEGVKGFAQGGFVLDDGSNASIFMNGSFDDSRIVEALENNNQRTPIRAYVFEKEITNAQDIEKRLQELSKL